MASLAMALFATMPAATAAAAQLRPLPPVDWDAFDDDARMHTTIGASVLTDQLASLAGTRGRLFELGLYRVAFRSGRVVLDFSGTAVRHFRDEELLEPPMEHTRAPNGRARVDTGDHLAATLFLLTSAGAPVDALVRFGTRLPTTDNAIGLDRDHTDFFATLAARAIRGPWSLAAEAGLGINGSRSAGFDQADVLVYSAELRLQAGRVVPLVTVVGHDGFTSRRIRGNEDLGEVRAGVRVGERRWVRIEAVAGYAEAAPDVGLLVTAGWKR